MEVEGHEVTQLRRGVVQHCVLALLVDEPQYSYDLVHALGEHPTLVTSEGTIYPLLSRLRREGLVATTMREGEGGPPRRYYELTGEGRRRLDDFRALWTAFRDATDQVLSTEDDT